MRTDIPSTTQPLRFFRSPPGVSDPFPYCRPAGACLACLPGLGLLDLWPPIHLIGSPRLNTHTIIASSASSPIQRDEKIAGEGKKMSSPNRHTFAPRGNVSSLYTHAIFPPFIPFSYNRIDTCGTACFLTSFIHLLYRLLVLSTALSHSPPPSAALINQYTLPCTAACRQIRPAGILHYIYPSSL